MFLLAFFVLSFLGEYIIHYASYDVIKDTESILPDTSIRNLYKAIQLESAFIPCAADKNVSHYCQTHYLTVWNSSSLQYSAYEPASMDNLVDGFTYTIQTSLSHFERVFDVETIWSGRIIVSLFAFRKDISEIETYLKRVTSTNILVVIYLVNSQKYFGRNDNCVYEEIKTTKETICSRMPFPIYPINTLRNLAIQLVQTRYYLTMDADMVPTPNIESTLNSINFTQYYNYSFFVIPSFQYIRKQYDSCPDVACFERVAKARPYTISELRQCILDGRCQIANSYLTTHRVIDKEWWLQKEPVQVLSCQPYRVMEPYVIVPRLKETPLYDETFINYGYNKVEFITELVTAGYHPHVLTGVFGFDIPHKPSAISSHYKEGEGRIIINRAIYYFRKRMKLYNESLSFPICDEIYAPYYYPKSFTAYLNTTTVP